MKAMHGVKCVYIAFKVSRASRRHNQIKQQVLIKFTYYKELYSTSSEQS